METATYNYLIWEDTVVTTTLGTDPNDTLDYAPGLEPYHQIVITTGAHGGQ